MKNLLSFEDYRIQLREMEKHVFNQEIGHVDEGLITKWKTFRSTRFVDKVLKDELELGKDFEQRIKTTMEELSKACEELETKSKKGSEFTRKVEKIIKEINSISFDALTLIGDQDIDFGGFRSGVIMANVVKLGALLSPVKNYLMIKKAYDYFLGLIKQSVRRDLVMLIVNFDQFQNVILQKSLESVENAKNAQELAQMEGELIGDYNNIFREMFKGKTKELDQAMKLVDKKRKERLEDYKHNPVMNLMMNSYDNTYKQTAETLKGFIGEDNQKQLDALKNGISKLGQGDEDLSVYGELLISTAEEKALKATNGIHNNFLKMSEVFKLSNQKNLIELISESEKEEQKRIKKENKEIKEKFEYDTRIKESEFFKSEFKKIKDKKDLSRISLKDIEKLKEEKVKFEYKDDKLNRETDRKYTEYDIITRYLAFGDDESNKELKKCSPDLKMLVATDKDSKNYKNTYYYYIDILSDTVRKSLVRENNNDDECYIDLSVLESLKSIEEILDAFGKKSKHKNTILKYISDNFVKFNYDVLLEKMEDITKGKNIEDIKQEYKDYLNKIKEYKDSKEYKEYVSKLREYSEIKSKLNKAKTESDKEKFKKDLADFGGEPKEPDGRPERIELSVKINSGFYKDWKEQFKKLGECSENNYTLKDDK